MANQRLNATVQIGSVLERSVKKNIGILRSGLEGVGDEIRAITKRQKELSKQRKVLEAQGRSVADLDREYEELGRELQRLERRQAAWTRAAKASARVGSDFRRMAGDIGRVARNAAIGVGLAGSAIFGLAKSTASLGDDVAKSADKLGIGVEAFQELRYAAERSGVPISTFDSSMTAFVKRLGEAKDGTGPAADALGELGLKVSDLIEMKPEDALGAVAERIKDIENPAERAAIAADLFSRAGVGMVNMLRDGNSGLEDLRSQARDTGYVLSEETARDAEAFQDSLLDAQLTIKGLKNTIGAEFMPVVQRSMDEFSTWARSNRDQVEEFSERAVAALERAIPVIGDVVSGMADVAGKVGTVVSEVADMVGGWEEFGTVLGALMASKAIISVGRFVGTVSRLGLAMWALAPALPVVATGVRAIGTALAANPIGLAITVIAGGAFLIWQNWEPISAFFSDMWGKVEEKFAAARVWVGETIDTLTKVSGIREAWVSVKESLDVVMSWIGEKFDWVMRKIEPVIDALKWARDKGVGIAESVMGDGTPSAGSVSRTERPAPAAVPAPATPSSSGSSSRVQSRATGGLFGPGPLLTGEHGPEFEFAARSGFIATNRQTEQMVARVEKARRIIGSTISADRAHGTLEGAAGNLAARTGGRSEVSGSGGSITNHIQINAAGMSPQALFDELERRMRDLSAGSLYDGTRGYGQYGGVA